MMGTSTLLRTAFAVASTLFCGKATAQHGFPFGSNDYAQTMIDKTISARTNAAAPQAAFPRTGILYIRGPEDTASNYLLYALQEVKSFDAAFKKYPRHIVGNGMRAIRISEVLAALDDLAKQDIDDIILVNFMHGRTSYHIQDVASDSGIVQTFVADGLLLSERTGGKLSADTLFGAIGARFRTNKNLHGKGLTVFHQPCSGEAALNAFHALPDGSNVFCYSGLQDSTVYTPEANLFTAAFGQLRNMALLGKRPEPVMNARTAFVTGFYAANPNFGAKENEVTFIRITGDKADTLAAFGRKFFLGSHSGVLIKPEALVGDVLTKFSENQIADELQDYDDVISRDSILAAIGAYKKTPSRAGFEALNLKTQACLNFVTVAIALNHTELLQNTLRYAAENKVIGSFGKKITYPWLSICPRPSE